MRPITEIIIHCSATKPDQDIGVKEIRHWHTGERHWPDIGYHYVIRRDGTVEPGRPLDKPGFHCRGHNALSIGVCLAGGLDDSGTAANNFTEPQWRVLERTVAELLHLFPAATVHGHNEFANKACPCFNVAAWWNGIWRG